MKTKNLLSILAALTVIFLIAGPASYSQDYSPEPNQPELGITIMGGFYWPWMDWTVEGSIKEEDKPDKLFYQEWRKGPNVRKDIGGIGIFYRKPTYGLRLTLQHGKSTKMIYETYEYEDGDGNDTTYTFAEGSRPHIYFSTYHFTFSAMQFFSLKQKKVNAYAGGGIGLTTLKYYDYISENYKEESDWGFHLFPLVGLEIRPASRAGIFVEGQYIIGSTFKKDITLTEGTLTYTGNYHLNTDGINLQAGIYFLTDISSNATSSYAERKLNFYTGSGLGMTLSPSLFKDYWKTGFNINGGIGYMMKPNFELIGRVTYNTFPLDDNKLLEGTSGITIDGMDFNMIQIEADVKYIFKAYEESSNFKPFGIVGIGMTNIKISDVTIKGDSDLVTMPFGDYSETKISMSAGFGFDYMFSSKFGMFLDGRLAIIMTSGDSFMYLPFKAGIKVGLGE